MLIKEYRVILPMTVEEYQKGQLFSVTEASRQETGGGEGVQVLRNEPFEGQNLFLGQFSSGQYTHKIYHFDTRVPALIRALMPRGSLTIHEHAWNAYPYCKTELTNPDFKNDKFFIRIETIHLNDRGTTENALHLTSDELSRREVVHIDIANDSEFLKAADIREDTKPSTYCSRKTGRGPLMRSWQTNCQPVMCVYKLVTINFEWFGIQTMIEAFGQKQFPRIFSKFNRELFCWMDRWYDKTLAEIRLIEKKTRNALDKVNNSTDKKTYAQVAAASPPQSEHGNGSEAGESPTNPNIVDLSNSGTKSGSTDSSIGSEPELTNAPLDSSKSADDGKPTDGQNSKAPEDKAAEEFMEVSSEEMKKKRARRRKAVAIIGGVFVGLAVVGAIWWAVRRRSNGG